MHLTLLRLLPLLPLGPQTLPNSLSRSITIMTPPTHSLIIVHQLPKVNQLETELTADDTTSAYLALAQTIPSAAEPIQDTSYALFHPLLAISILVAAITDTPSSKVNFSKWYNPATHLLKGLLGCQVWHKSPECLKRNDPATVNTVKTYEGDQQAHETEEAAGLAEVLALNITESVSPLLIKCWFHVDSPYFLALFDIGTSISLIDPSLVDMNQLWVMTALRSWQVALAGGIAGLKLCQMVEEDIWIGDAKYKCAAFVMPLGKHYQAILSLNFILTHGFLTGTTILEQVMLHTTHPFMVSSLATDPH
ncbi:hypothetical protein LQV05_006089 [Cryptococcus neoformans]|nr:hypothetical protein LQV05_006089 [Cryptococcus neoformans]